MRNDCNICAQIKGDPANDLISKLMNENHSEYTRRIILETTNFVVIPSLGPLVEGHVLICPKFHARSTALIDPIYFPELQELKKSVTELLNECYNKPVHLFEHGNGLGSLKSLCTVDHAHLHVFPDVRADFLAEYNSEEMTWQLIPNDFHSIRDSAREKEYLIYGNPEGALYFSSCFSKDIPSQWFRKLVANALGANNWDWRQFSRLEEVNATYLKLSGLAEQFNFTGSV